MRVTYNAPFVLTFTLIASLVMFLNQHVIPGITEHFFALLPVMSYKDPLTYPRFVTYVFGHANWNHLMSNLTFLLLLGPMLEEKYGSNNLIIMALITALVTGFLNHFLFSTGLIGASGIVFMMILLSSFTNVRAGYIPLTFLLVLVLFLSKEVMNAFVQNNISEFSHIVGGICGSVFGFWKRKTK